MKMAAIQVKALPSRHPKRDWIWESKIKKIENHFWYHCSFHQDCSDWLLPVTEFSYSPTVSKILGRSPCGMDINWVSRCQFGSTTLTKVSVEAPNQFQKMHDCIWLLCIRQTPVCRMQSTHTKSLNVDKTERHQLCPKKIGDAERSV